MFNVNKAYGVIAPTVVEEKDGFVVTIYNEKLSDIDNVTDRVALISLEMKQNKSITTKELAEKLNVSRRTILRAIEKLKRQEVLKRIGYEKSGYWEIMDK